MKALAHGEIADAALFNPLVVTGVFVVLVWFVWTVATMKMACYQREWVVGTDERSDQKRGWRWGIVISVLLLLNWVYLICYLPQ